MTESIKETAKRILKELGMETRLKLLVVDATQGKDAAVQAKAFDDAVGVDAILVTKMDVATKGAGTILNVCNAIKKPVIFVTDGQECDKIKFFKPDEFVKELLGD